MRCGKKGQEPALVTIFLAIGLMLAAVSGLILFSTVSKQLDGTLLEQRYIAKDLAMTLEAVYASPGNIEYTYNLAGYMKKFVIAIDDKVSVRSKGDVNGVSYRIIGSNRVALQGVVVSITDEDKAVKLTLSKTFEDDGSAVISINAVNAGVTRIG